MGELVLCGKIRQYESTYTKGDVPLFLSVLFGPIRKNGFSMTVDSLGQQTQSWERVDIYRW